MKCKKIKAMYFSPTGHSQSIVNLVANVASKELQIPIETIDFTLPSRREVKYLCQKDDLVIFAVPTYAGRIPNKILPFVQNGFSSEDSPTIGLVTFGNRDYGSSLQEVKEELGENGFRLFAAGAFVASHVFSPRITGIRPDDQDKDKIQEFALRTCQKLKEAKEVQDLTLPIIGSNQPVGPYYTPKRSDGQDANFLKAKPKTKAELCIDCGICARVCPMGSIDFRDYSQVPGVCIKCQACIVKCPNEAKFFEDPDFLSHVKMLEENFTQRREAQYFF